MSHGGNTYYKANREKILKTKRDYYQKNREVIINRQTKYYRDRKRNDPLYGLQYRIWSKEAYINRREEKLQWQKDYWRKHRIELLTYIGGHKCKHCGFKSDWRALQIDHVYGGGGKDPFRTKKPNLLLAWLKKNPNRLKEYQVLCANCNRIKAVENNECRGREKLEVLLKELNKMKAELKQKQNGKFNER